MFSGIIERLAPVESADLKDATLLLVLGTGHDDLELGESIAVNGVCLTVTHIRPGGAASFFVSSETCARSNLGRLQPGDTANIERALRLDTRLSGHLVQGHVDGLARLVSADAANGAHVLRVAVADDLGRYCVEKGSITLNGISLTINSVASQAAETVLSLTIIPHTWTHTNLHAVRVGDPLNVEVDVIAKYVERLCQPYQKP